MTDMADGNENAKSRLILMKCSVRDFPLRMFQLFISHE